MRSFDLEHRLDVVLIGIASRPAELLEFWVIHRVLDDRDGEVSVSFEPLPAFAPLFELDLRPSGCTGLSRLFQDHRST